MKYNAYSATFLEKRKNEIEKLTPEENVETEAAYMKESVMVQSYLERGLTAETFQSLSAMDDE